MKNPNNCSFYLSPNEVSKVFWEPFRPFIKPKKDQYYLKKYPITYKAGYGKFSTLFPEFKSCFFKVNDG